MFQALEESRQEAIRDARLLLDHEWSRAQNKTELISNLRKLFHNTLCCKDLGRNNLERNYYLVLCEQIEHHITLISEGRLGLATNDLQLNQD